MKTSEVNHRQCHLYRGPGIRHLVEAIAHRTPTETVDDVVAAMKLHFPPEKREQFADVDRKEHKARQHVLCSRCLQPITMSDVHVNECSHCGSEIFKGRIGTK